MLVKTCTANYSLYFPWKMSLGCQVINIQTWEISSLTTEVIFLIAGTAISCQVLDAGDHNNFCRLATLTKMYKDHVLPTVQQYCDSPLPICPEWRAPVKG